MKNFKTKTEVFVMEKKQKRYYKIGEKVWLKKIRKSAYIKKLIINQDEKIYKADIEYTIFRKGVAFKANETVNLWDIDKFKKENNKDTIYFAKLSENAIIPSKRDEDAGYDFYACLDDDIQEIELNVGKPTLIPTGIATALPKHLYFNLKHERGSTGKLGMNVLSGVVDSGYRGEIFINICSLYKKIIISKEVEQVIEKGGVIYYPAKKAIAQGTIDLVPKAYFQEIPYEELKNMKSERGTQMLGASGK
jgi:dUTP pyrophosphatase